MKRLYRNLFGIIVLVVLLLIGIDFMSMRGYTRDIIADLTDSTEYLQNNGPEFVNPIIRKAQKEDGTTKLLVGDSVCYQLFNGLQEFNPDFSILPSNGALTMTGQYALAKEYLDHHPDATDIYLIILPESIGRTFDTKWGYQYAVVPFVETDTISNYDENTIRIINDTYGELFTRKTVATAVERSGINRKLYLNYMRGRTEGYVLSDDFELSDQYLTKLLNLCNERDVNLHFYPCPVIEGKKDYVSRLSTQYPKTQTYLVNPDYFDMIYYYPDELSGDGSHISTQYLQEVTVEYVIRKMLDGEPILDSLKFN